MIKRLTKEEKETIIILLERHRLDILRRSATPIQKSVLSSALLNQATSIDDIIRKIEPNNEVLHQYREAFEGVMVKSEGVKS